MSSTYHQVTTLALQLPAEDRLALASELIDSVEEPADPEWERAWLEELHARRKNGLGDARPWSEVRAEILRRLTGP